MVRKPIPPPLIFPMALSLASLACAFPGTPPTSQIPNVDTAVAGTLAAIADNTPTESTPTPTPVTSTPIPNLTITPTFTAPPDGISLNCDGSYQRVNLTDGGEQGKTISVESWIDAAWVEVWALAGGDPMLLQIEDEAGAYLFGDCGYLINVPMRHSGSGAVLELRIFAWNGETMDEVYFHDGVNGDWQKIGNMITFQESIYLLDEPNCCPCNTQYLEHVWNGSSFEQSGSLILPTYTGDPPPYCVP